MVQVNHIGYAVVLGHGTSHFHGTVCAKVSLKGTVRGRSLKFGMQMYMHWHISCSGRII